MRSFGRNAILFLAAGVVFLCGSNPFLIMKEAFSSKEGINAVDSDATDSATKGNSTNKKHANVETPPPPRRPNILILYADQHQAACTGYEGHPDVITPNLDKLASEGVRFSRAYANNGICAASRVAFMSGLYPRTTGILDNQDLRNNEELRNATEIARKAKTMASTFAENGYVTVAIGKRHLWNKAGQGLDAGWHVRKSHRYGRDLNSTYVQWLIQQGISNRTGRPFIQDFADDWCSQGGTGPDGGNLSPYGDFGPSYKYQSADLATRTSQLPPRYTMEAWSTKETIDHIRRRDKNKPFFIWSTFYHPHQPYNPQPRFLKQYSEQRTDWNMAWGAGRRNGGQIKKPANLNQPSNELPPLLKSIRQRVKKPWNCGDAARDNQLYRNYMAAYYALVTEMDHHVGEILNVLEKQGVANDTIVVYTSDHGDFVGRHGMAEKVASGHAVYDDIFRVPLIMKWPGHFLTGHEINGLVESVDVYPTLMDLAGISLSEEAPYELSGSSLVPGLTGTADVGKDFVVAENWYGISIFTNDYKLSTWNTGANLRKGYSDYSGFGNLLFDRGFHPSESHASPLETQNYYSNRKHQGVVHDLEEMLKEWLNQTNSVGRDARISVPKTIV